MKKNNIILFLLMALPTLLLTSCLKDQEDIFSDSASARAEKYLANAKKVLTSAENGWVLNYYPDRNQSYGGYAFTLKFNDQTVEVGAEIAVDVTETIESSYILNNEDGPVLTFDTYNAFMHYFSTPHGSSGAGGYQAYDGDFIFIIMDISEDENTITLKGNRSGNIMYMHRLTTPADEYLQKLVELENMMPTSYNYTDGSDFITVSLSGGTARFNIGEEETEEVAYIYTLDGVEFYEPITVKEQTMTGIQYIENAEQVPALGNSTVMLNVVYLPANEIFLNNDWYIAYSMLGSYAQPYFDKAKAGSDSEGEEISIMALTVLYSGYVNLYFMSGPYAGALGFDYELEGDDQITLTYNAAGNDTNGNGGWYYKNAGYNNLVVPLSRTFKLEPDSKVKPTRMVMRDQSEPTNVITVTTNPVSNPFDN